MGLPATKPCCNLSISQQHKNTAYFRAWLKKLTSSPWCMFTEITISEMPDGVYVPCAYVIDSLDLSGEVVKLVVTTKEVGLT